MRNFAGDANEALASLAEPPESHTEATVDAEEVTEVDRSHNVDIF